MSFTSIKNGLSCSINYSCRIIKQLLTLFFHLLNITKCNISFQSNSQLLTKLELYPRIELDSIWFNIFMIFKIVATKTHLWKDNNINIVGTFVNIKGFADSLNSFFFVLQFWFNLAQQCLNIFLLFFHLIFILYFSLQLVIMASKFVAQEFIWPEVAFDDCLIIGILCILIARYMVRKRFNSITIVIGKSFIGSVVVITGAATGIGQQLVSLLCKQQCKIIILDVDRINMEINMTKWRKQKHIKCILQYVHMDLASPESIQKAAAEVIKKNTRITHLINIAGLLGLPKRQLTSEGIQMQMAINYLGHCRLTFLLMKVLEQSPKFRILNMCSLVYKYTPNLFEQVKIDFDDFFYTQGPYNPFKAYSMSKLCTAGFTIMMAYELQLRNIKGKIISMHPGIVQTSLKKHKLIGFNRFIFTVFFPLFYLFFSRSSQQAASVILSLMCQNYELLKNGMYYNMNHVEQYSKYALNKEFQKQLWKRTIQYIKPEGNWALN